MKNEDNKLSLEDFNKRPYPVVIRNLLDKVHLFDPKLHIFIEAHSVQSAYDLYQAEKTSFYHRLDSIDALHLIPALSETPGLRQRVDLQKIVIERLCSFVLTLIFWVLFIVILFHQVNKSAVKISEAFLPVEADRKEARLLKFRERLEVIAPYVREVKKVFNE